MAKKKTTRRTKTKPSAAQLLAEIRRGNVDVDDDDAGLALSSLSAPPEPEPLEDMADLARARRRNVIGEIEASCEDCEGLDLCLVDGFFFSRVVIADYGIDDPQVARVVDATRTMTFVDDADGTLQRLLFLTGAGVVYKIEVRRLNGPAESRPLWETDRVTLDDGTVVRGAGKKRLRERRKPGPKPRGTGRMTREAYDRARRADAAREKRLAATQTKIQALRASGDNAAAAKVSRRSRAARKVTKIKGKPRFTKR